MFYFSSLAILLFVLLQSGSNLALQAFQNGGIKPVEIRKGILNKYARKLPKPKYPEEAKAAGISGEVKVEVTIEVLTGKVTKAKAISGHLILQPAAEDAARKAEFSPTHGNVIVKGILVYNFNLPKKGIINPLASKLPKPIYPEEAKAKDISGTVEVEVVVDFEQGEVIKAIAISGNELLQSAAIDAAYKAKFAKRPTHFEGKTLTGILVYRFNLPIKKYKSTNINKNQ